MNLFLISHVTWVLALHVMAFVSWMAGLFYLPRLFVYHTQVQYGSSESDRFTLMERRLLKQIMVPAMIVTFMSGGVLSTLPGIIDWSAPWWWVKLACVVGMFGFHIACVLWWRGFAQGKNIHRERYYRYVNEIPTVLMIIIVIMIIVRP